MLADMPVFRLLEGAISTFYLAIRCTDRVKFGVEDVESCLTKFEAICAGLGVCASRNVNYTNKCP